MKPPTIEEAFGLGAEAMRSRIAATAMAKGDVETAIKVLEIACPKFSLPETFSVE